MRIYGPSGTSQTTAKTNARRSSSTGFSIEDTSAPVETRPAAAPRTAGGIEALLAMQGFDDPGERRKRSVQRGRNALDVLDDMKIGLLTGALDSSMVGRLRMAAADLKSTSGDPRLDQVLSEIELRVEVELAKAGQVRPVNTGF
jgi:Class II flagellar assembly regulator